MGRTSIQSSSANTESSYGDKKNKNALKNTGGKRRFREKTYRCELCRKSYTQLSTLKDHQKTHIEQKPHRCSQCNKSYSYLSGLNQHLKLHSQQNLHVCNVCQKSFTQLGHLTIHQRIHSGERPYKCNLCQNSFTQVTGLDQHLRIHNGDRPYVCHICLKSFIQSSSMNSHMRMHHREKPYKCKSCEKSFTQLSNLNQHMRSHIGEKRSASNESSTPSITRRKRLRKNVGETLCSNKIKQKSIPKTPENQVEKSQPLNLSTDSPSLHLNQAFPYGCVLCDDLFEKEKDFLNHCWKHVINDPSGCVTDMNYVI